MHNNVHIYIVYYFCYYFVYNMILLIFSLLGLALAIINHTCEGNEHIGTKKPPNKGHCALEKGWRMSIRILQSVLSILY